MAVDQLVNCPRGVRPRARRHSVSVCQVMATAMMMATMMTIMMAMVMVTAMTMIGPCLCLSGNHNGGDDNGCNCNCDEESFNHYYDG